MSYEEERDRAGEEYANTDSMVEAGGQRRAALHFDAGADWSRSYWCRWRDAEKERPDVGVKCIARTFGGNYYLAKFDDKHRQWITDTTFTLVWQIKEWLPLPGWDEKDI